MSLESIMCLRIQSVSCLSSVVYSRNTQIDLSLLCSQRELTRRYRSFSCAHRESTLYEHRYRSISICLLTCYVIDISLLCSQIGAPPNPCVLYTNNTYTCIITHVLCIYTRNTHIHIYIYTHTYIYTYIYIHIHIYIYVCCCALTQCVIRVRMHNSNAHASR